MTRKAITRMQAIIAGIIIIIIVVAGVVAGYYLTVTPSKPTITIAVWGGAWETGIVNALSGFEKAYNCKVDYFVQSNSLETIETEVSEASHPTIDVIMTGPSQAMTGIAAGIVEPINTSLVPNLAGIFPSANLVINGSTYFAGNSLNFMGIAVNTNKINATEQALALASWKWMWSPVLSPKLLGVPTPTYYGMPIQASYAWFGDQYHNALNQSWAELVKLAPNIGLAYSTDSVATEALTSGTIDALMCYQTDAYGMIQAGAPVAFIVPQNEPMWLFPNGPIAIKNGPAGTKLQMEMINWLLSANAVTAYCTGIAANPTNVNSTVPISMLPYMLSSARLAKLPVINFQYVANETNSWQTTWDSLITPII
jgi:spermidine/putrescine-binding protein